jgi:glucose-6-phosphate isomerase
MGINKFLTTIKLKHQARKLSRKKMKDMFLREKDRFDNFSIKIDNLLFDYSKNLIDEKH